MPTYRYRCSTCGDELEVWQSFSEEPLTVHANCGGELRKVLSPAGIVLKGSGFYKTDNRSGSNGGGSRSPEKQDSESTSSGSSDSSSSPAKDAGSSSSGSGDSGSSSSGSGSSDSSSSTSSTTSDTKK